MGADTVEAKAQLLDLLELAFGMESETPSTPGTGGHKLTLLDN
jgi:hypothetical protein